MQRAALLAWVLVAAGCGKTSDEPARASGSGSAISGELTATDRAALATMSPLPAPAADPSNALADDPRAATLGQMLFFDEALSATGTVACSSCHAGPAMDDAGKHVSMGVKRGTRNSPPVINSVFYTWLNWGGRFDSPWALTLGAVEKHDVMAAKRDAIAEVIKTKYSAEMTALIGPLAERSVDEIFVAFGKSVAAYMRLLVARDAPFDRWIAGDEAAISAAAKRGAHLFVLHCKSCHDGPHFTDNKFHALGAAQFGEGVPAEDLGRFGDLPPLLASPFRSHSDIPAQAPEMRSQFRTPTLRNVAVTAPYMHAGQFATLDAVMAFYNAGGGKVDAGVTKAADMKRLGLTQAQQADLVAFMQTLTDINVPAPLRADTARRTN